MIFLWEWEHLTHLRDNYNVNVTNSVSSKTKIGQVPLFCERLFKTEYWYILRHLSLIVNFYG